MLDQPGTIAPITICGGPTSGKSTLTALLEGLPGIFALPLWHDCLSAGLCYLSAPFWRNTVHFRENITQLWHVRHVLCCHTRWLDLEIFARQRYVPYSLSGSRLISIPFSLDVYHMEKVLADRVASMPHYDEATVFDAAASVLHEFLHPQEAPPPRRAVSMGPVDFYRFEMLAERYPKGKAIYIDRRPAEALASYVHREAALSGKSFAEAGTEYFTRYGAMIQRMFKARAHAREWAGEHPEMLRIIPFNELILHTEPVMRALLDWLGVPFSPLALRGTWQGNCIDAQCTGVIHDAVLDSLSATEREFLEERIAEWDQPGQREPYL